MDKKKNSNLQPEDLKNKSALSPIQFNIISVAIIFLSVWAVYYGSLGHSFQFDDVHHIHQNRNIKDFQIFTDPEFWFDFNNRAPAQFTLALNYAYGGYDVSGYRLVNILIHISAAVSVFFLAGFLLSSSNIKNHYIIRNKRIIQLFTVLLFAVHPVQTESVTYIVQRMESLSALFYFGGLILYVMFRNEKINCKKILYLSGFAALTVLAVLTKQTSYSMPLAILLLEVFFIRSGEGEPDRKLIITLSALILAVTITAWMAEYLPREYMSDMSRSDYFLTQLKVIPLYFGLMLLPFRQNIDHHITVPESLSDPFMLSGASVVILLVFSCFYLYKRGHVLLSFGIAWVFVSVSLRSSILPISDLMTERRLYGAVFGYGLFVSSSIFLIKENYFRSAGRKAFVFMLSALVIVLSAATVHRNKVWETELTLWKDSVEKSPEKFRPNYNVAEAYKRSGNSHGALSYYMKAYAINNRSYGLCNNIGNIYSEKQMWAEAEKYYILALSIKPDYPKALNNLANVYFRKKDYINAEKYYISASEADKNYVDPVLNLGHLYYSGGFREQAADKYREVLRMDPGNKQAQNNLEIIEKRHIPIK